MQGYLPLLQKRNKWRTIQYNLQPGQLVLVGDSDYLFVGGLTVWVVLKNSIPKFAKGKKLSVKLQWPY